MKLRIQVTKHGRMRFLSHSEFSRTLMFAARRTGLPLAYGGKYRPRMKISLSPPLPIGITSECELVDFFLERYVSPMEAEEAISSSLPKGIELVRCRLMGKDSRPVGKLIDTAAYVVFLPAGSRTAGEWAEAVEIFLSKDVVNFERVQPRRTRVVNLRPGVHLLRFESDDAQGAMVLRMILDDGTRGTVKPREVLEVLADYAALSESGWQEARIHRTGLFARRGDRLVSPMDLGRGKPAI